MAQKSFRNCNYPGCSKLTKNTYCEEHEGEVKKKRGKRESSSRRGYNYQWQKEREKFLRRNPLCTECMKENKITPAKIVDHIVPHKGDMKLFWDRSNWQPLCKRCHDSKTAREDGGFGNEKNKR